MGYLLFGTFALLIIVTIATLSSGKVKLGPAITIIASVVATGIALYWMVVQENPWYKGKRALEWSLQMQDWRSDAEAAEAAKALDEIGDKGLASLSLAIESEDARVTKKAADVIASVCSRTEELDRRHMVTFKHMLEALRASKDSSVRIHIAKAFSRCGPVAHNEAVEDGLTAVAREDPDAAVREAASHALEEVHLLPKPRR